MTIAENLTRVSQNVPNVFAAGKAEECREFWDTFQSNGTRKNYSYAFRMGWRDEIYNPAYPIVCTGSNSASNMFAYTKVKDTKVPITVNGNNLSVFYEAATVTIRKLTIGDGVTQMIDWFNNCADLENIEFDGTIPVSTKFGQSKKLSPQSIISIVSHLSQTAEGQSVTFSTDAVNNADWSQTEYGSWDNLIATRSNWTFALV